MAGNNKYRTYWMNREPRVSISLCESIGGISAMVSGLKSKDKIRDIRDWCNYLLEGENDRLAI